MSKRRTPAIDQLKAAIRRAERAGITRYRIAQDSGVSEAQLSRIMAGTLTAPRLDTVTAIAKATAHHVIIAPD